MFPIKHKRGNHFTNIFSNVIYNTSVDNSRSTLVPRYGDILLSGDKLSSQDNKQPTVTIVIDTNISKVAIQELGTSIGIDSLSGETTKEFRMEKDMITSDIGDSVDSNKDHMLFVHSEDNIHTVAIQELVSSSGIASFSEEQLDEGVQEFRMEKVAIPEQEETCEEPIQEFIKIHTDTIPTPAVVSTSNDNAITFSIQNSGTPSSSCSPEKLPITSIDSPTSTLVPSSGIATQCTNIRNETILQKKTKITLNAIHINSAITIN